MNEIIYLNSVLVDPLEAAYVFGGLDGTGYSEVSASDTYGAAIILGGQTVFPKFTLMAQIIIRDTEAIEPEHNYISHSYIVAEFDMPEIQMCFNWDDVNKQGAAYTNESTPRVIQSTAPAADLSSTSITGVGPAEIVYEVKFPYIPLGLH